MRSATLHDTSATLASHRRGRYYILRAIFLRGPPRLSWEFIGVSLARATLRREVGPGGRSFPIAERVRTYGRRVRPRPSSPLCYATLGFKTSICVPLAAYPARAGLQT
jgi:hypothetical protein